MHSVSLSRTLQCQYSIVYAHVESRSMPALINTSTTSSWPPLQAKWSGVGEDLSQSLTALSWQLSSSWTTLEETLDICSSSKLHSGKSKVEINSRILAYVFSALTPWAMMTRIHQLTQPYTYRRSRNFRVTKFSFFKFSCKNTFMVWDTHEKFLTTLNQFCIPWFSYLEWDYEHQKHGVWWACCIRGQIVATM